MSDSSVGSATLVRLIPMLAVRDLSRTIEWYTLGLGFDLREAVGDPPVWCYLHRDGVRLFFNQPPASTFPPDWPGHVPASGHAPHRQPREGHPTEQIRSLQIFYMHVDNLPAPHAELAARELAPTEMRVTHYGMKEFELRDPDGYWLWFGEDTDETPTDEIEAIVDRRFDERGNWASPPRGIESALEGAEIRQAIDGCLEGVPNPQRMAFVLREVEGLVSEEICEILEVTRTKLDQGSHCARGAR